MGLLRESAAAGSPIVTSQMRMSWVVVDDGGCCSQSQPVADADATTALSRLLRPLHYSLVSSVSPAIDQIILTC